MMRTMIKRNIRTVSYSILAVVSVAAAGFGAWKLLVYLWYSYLSTLDAEVLAALVTGALVATGAIYAKYLEHRHSVEAQFRDSKVELFNNFMALFGRISGDDLQQEDVVSELKEWSRQLLFWGGPGVVKAAHSMKDMPNTSTVGGFAKALEKMGTLIIEMRKDLGLSNRGIADNIPVGVNQATVLAAKQILRHPNLFLQCLLENPSMPMAEMASREAELDLQRGI